MKYIIFYFLLIRNLTLAQTELDTTVYTIVDQMPRFPGCEEIEGDNDVKKSCADQKLLKYIYTELHISIEVDKSQIDSKLVVSFVINKEGYIEQVTILRSLHPLIDENVVNLLKNMPQWTPGKLRGKAVNVIYNLPLRLCFR